MESILTCLPLIVHSTVTNSIILLYLFSDCYIRVCYGYISIVDTLSKLNLPSHSDRLSTIIIYWHGPVGSPECQTNSIL